MQLRSLLILSALLVSFSAVLHGQAPVLETDKQNTAAVPTVVFDFVFPQARPNHYAITTDSLGRAAYRSDSTPEEGQPPGEPYMMKFVISESGSSRIFQLTRELDYFQKDFNYTKSKIANLGAKTLTFRDAGREHRTSYNYSENVKLKELTSVFQGISATLEFGRRLDELHHFSPLGLDAELKKLESEEKAGRLAEMQLIESVLARIAMDRSVLNVARRRAEGVLARIHNNAETDAKAGA